jgi:hypothetical protein
MYGLNVVGQQPELDELYNKLNHTWTHINPTTVRNLQWFPSGSKTSAFIYSMLVKYIIDPYREIIKCSLHPTPKTRNIYFSLKLFKESI